MVDTLHELAQTKVLGEGGPEGCRSGPGWGETHLGSRQVCLSTVDGAHSLRIALAQTGSLLIGRQDRHTGSIPDVDLSGFDAYELGVSRRHARLEQREDRLYLADLGSSNGTCLGGRRISPHQAVLVRDGDEIMCGHLRLLILFEDSAGETRSDGTKR